MNSQQQQVTADDRMAKAILRMARMLLVPKTRQPQPRLRSLFAVMERKGIKT